MFTKLPGRFQQMSNDKTVTSDGPDDCAMACNDPTLLKPCNSFDYCSKNNLCGLSRQHSQDGTLTKNAAMCDHYDRTCSIIRDFTI